MSTIPRPSSTVEPRPWQTGLAPVYIGIFLWIAFLDQLGRRALPIGGLGWSMLGALVAGPLGYLLLFRVSATWGQQVGKPIDVIATSTFGARGARLVPGILIGLGQLIFFAIAIGYAVDFTLQGLVMGRLIDPRALRPMMMGEASLPSPLFLGTTLVWTVAAALVSNWFIRWIAALMQIFPIFPAILLGLAMVAWMRGLTSFQPSHIDPLDGSSIPEELRGWKAFTLTFQWVFAYTAMAGVVGADWGAGSTSPRDVREGGWVGVAFAPVVISALVLMTVAGHQGTIAAANQGRGGGEPGVGRFPVEGLPSPVGGRAPALGSEGPRALATPSTFRSVLMGTIDRRLACVMLLVFGLASMAPAVYASFVFGSRFSAIGPNISKLGWTMMGAVTAWLLIVGGWFDRTETLFNALGATFAAVAGAMAADFVLRRGKWSGPRHGFNLPGLVAWTLGTTVGLAPTVARAFGSERASQIQPAALAGFAVAFVTYAVMAMLKLESKPVV